MRWIMTATQTRSRVCREGKPVPTLRKRVFPRLSLKDVRGAGDLAQGCRQRPAESDSQHEYDGCLGDRGQVVAEQPILQPEHDRIVHEEDAVGIALHAIKYDPGALRP